MEAASQRESITRAITRWLDHEQRRMIAARHGVTTRQQIYNVMSGKSKNFSLLAELVEQAEENKRIYERARQLEDAST